MATKLALVTGASRGIGAAIAKQLKEDGYDVLTASRTTSDLTVDFENKKHVLALLEALPAVDILINNVGGTLDITDPFCSEEDWNRIHWLNYGVAVFLSRHYSKKMIEAGWGRIINVCSTSSLENNGPVPYCAAKAALAAYTRSMGRVLAKTEVVMSGLIVGAINTAGGFWEKQTEEHRSEYLRTRCPRGKFGEERAVSDMVSFLVTDKADFSQGALFTVDGGQSRHYFNQV